MKVYHGNYENKEFIGEVETQGELNKLINDYIKKIKFRCYYNRQWLKDDGTLVIDYGSHTEFFFVEGLL